MIQPPPELRDLTAIVPAVQLDIRYATTNNFTGKQQYNHQIAWLRPEPHNALQDAATEFAEEGFTIVVFDAFRPRRVHERLKEAYDNREYVSEVSSHCRGISIDLTLANSSGAYLDMGTDFDEFTPKAHADATGITQEQQTNRALLNDIMHRHGFVQHPNEWWHFDFKPDQHWSLINDELNTYTGN